MEQEENKESILNQMQNEKKLTPEIEALLIQFIDADYPIQSYLPISIDQTEIKKLRWKDFQGKAIQDSWFLSYTLWNVTYNIQVKKIKNKYRINPKVQAHLKNNSWTKYTDKQLDESMWLLNHEQGHYLIGSIVALDFKLQTLKQQFTQNYNQELKELFNKILKEYCKLEKIYDKETYHALNPKEQKDWDFFFISKIEVLKYEINKEIETFNLL